MSLFERIKYKRYDLQEKKKTTSSSASSGNNKPDENISTGRKRIRKAISDLDATQPKIETGKTTYNKNKNVSQDIGQRRTAQSNQQQIFNRQYDAYDDGDLGNPSQTKSQTSPRVTTGKGVNQADVSKQAQEFTKKVNKERIVKQKNIFGGEDFVKDKSLDKLGRNRRRVKRKYNIPGQQSLDLGGDVTKKTPTPRLSKSGEVVTDLRTIGRKPRNIRKRRIDAKPPKPEKMVVVKDPVKGGFKKVGATTTQGSKMLRTKQFASTKELLEPRKIAPLDLRTKKPKQLKPPTTKPNLFTRIKDFVKGEPKIPPDYRLLRGTEDVPVMTRKVYKGKLGAVRKFVDKLPRRYKIAGTAFIATAAAVPSIKKAFAPKPEKKSYTVANKTLKLDTGKKNT